MAQALRRPCAWSCPVLGWFRLRRLRRSRRRPVQFPLPRLSPSRVPRRASPSRPTQRQRSPRTAPAVAAPATALASMVERAVRGRGWSPLSRPPQPRRPSLSMWVAPAAGAVVPTWVPPAGSTVERRVEGDLPLQFPTVRVGVGRQVCQRAAACSWWRAGAAVPGDAISLRTGVTAAPRMALPATREELSAVPLEAAVAGVPPAREAQEVREVSPRRVWRRPAAQGVVSPPPRSAPGAQAATTPAVAPVLWLPVAEVAEAVTSAVVEGALRPPSWVPLVEGAAVEAAVSPPRRAPAPRTPPPRSEPLTRTVG